jgi:hypothetical protein
MTAHNKVCTATRPASDQVCTRADSYRQAKTCAIDSGHRDHFLAKAPGLCTDASSSNAYEIIPPGR